MSESAGFKIGRTSDCKLNECFREAAQKWPGNAGSASLVGGVQVKCGFTAEPDEKWLAVLKADAEMVQSLSVVYGGNFSIEYHRGGQVPQAQKSPFFDELLFRFTGQGGGPTELERIQIVNFFQKALGRMDPKRAIGEGLTPEQGEAIALHQETLTRLESLNESLVKTTDEYRVLLDERFDERIALKEKELQALKEKLEKEHESRNEKLDQEKIRFEERIKEFDARDNTVVRRQIRDGMLEEVKQRVQRFGVSEHTAQKRVQVRLAIALLGFLMLMLWVGTFIELRQFNQDRSSLLTQVEKAVQAANNSSSEVQATAGRKAFIDGKEMFLATHDSAELYWLWGRLALLSFGLFGTLIYFARWENAWAERHANAEFQLQQFHLDVNRANWVVESCLEWKKETDNAVIPSELLSSMTRNLFVDKGSQPEQVLHPADELASAILGSAAQVKLKAPGADILIDKPGKKLGARLENP
jgi:hypothetical protein